MFLSFAYHVTGACERLYLRSLCFLMLFAPSSLGLFRGLLFVSLFFKLFKPNLVVGRDPEYLEFATRSKTYSAHFWQMNRFSIALFLMATGYYQSYYKCTYNIYIRTHRLFIYVCNFKWLFSSTHMHNHMYVLMYV